MGKGRDQLSVDALPELVESGPERLAVVIFDVLLRHPKADAEDAAQQVGIKVAGSPSSVDPHANHANEAFVGRQLVALLPRCGAQLVSKARSTPLARLAQVPQRRERRRGRPQAESSPVPPRPL